MSRQDIGSTLGLQIHTSKHSMKNSIILIVILLVAIQFGHAQNGLPGIYRTVTEFNAGKPSEVLDCKHGKKTIRVSSFFLSPYLFFRQQDEKLKIPIEQVYAFFDCDQQLYRICGYKAYKLCDSTYFNIYSYTAWESVKVRTSRMTHLEKKRVTHYYFSPGDSSKIAPLSLNEVLLAVGDDPEKRQLIIQNFPSTKSLLKTDGDSFLLNKILSECKN